MADVKNQAAEKETLMYKIGAVCSAVVQKCIPDAMCFAIGLLFIVTIAALALTDYGIMGIIDGVGNGMWALISFAYQVASTLLFSNILGNTKACRKILGAICSIPKTPKQAMMMAALVGCICSLISWAFGLVAAALYCREVVRHVKGIDYACLVACGYCGFLVWHGGLTATIPLAFQAGGYANAVWGGDGISFNHFVVTKWNLFFDVFFTITIPLICGMFCPPPSKVKEVDPALLAVEEVDFSMPKNPTAAQFMEHTPLFNWFLGIIMAAWAVTWFAKMGVIAGITMNAINLVFYCLSLLCVKNIKEFSYLVAKVGAGCAPLMCQFPIYAAIMTIMQKSGLAAMIANLIASIATARTLPNFIYVSSSILNMIIPSGGGKFSVEAPIYIPVVQELGGITDPTDIGLLIKTMNAAMWGDATTNLVQPFWALPLLAIANLGIRDIMGYCAIICFYGIIMIEIFLYVLV